jgi:hypothetical protein
MTLERNGSAEDIGLHESNAVAQSRPNILIEGHESFVADTLVALGQDLLKSAVDWQRISDFSVPPDAVILIRDVGRLKPSDWLKLSVWLENARPRIQVVSTSTAALYPLAQRGDFPLDLYYRLNTVTLRQDGAVTSTQSGTGATRES